ncbi:MAG: polysaccharide pyruvyl transferase family protein [Clostridia bacterium]|nr:polysaccharide pyruvyl transferase family protein [Clostridia bacterium]
MRTVNIVTKHSAYNFGAMLQAYALQKTMQELGADCKIIDLRQPKPTTSWSWKSPGGIVRNLSYILHKRELLQGFARFEQFIEDYPKTKRYDSDWELYSDIPQADVYLSGSDQVWNPLKISEAAFLRFAPETSIRASYAASLGISYIPKGGQRLISEYLVDFDKISVREQTGREILEKITKQEIGVHVDPTLLREKKEWEAIAVPTTLKKPYILCYILYRPQWLNKWLKNIRRQTKKDIVVVSSDVYRNIYHNKMVRSAGPKEFLGLIQGADYVISSSFHGVALSIANEKPFYAIVNPDSPSRISNLLKTFSLQDRIVTEKDSLDFSEMDYTQVAPYRVKEKEKAIAYLSSLLKMEKTMQPIQEKTLQFPKDTVSIVGNKCTACTVCANVCPTKAIIMEPNEYGFLYPKIDESKCTRCGLCTKKCHALTREKNTKETCEVFYGWIKDEEFRRVSSSGGVFTALSDAVLRDNGLIVAAYFDAETKKVRHASSDDVDFAKFRRSKYAESEMEDSLAKIDTALRVGRKVLFCGTPCQCAGVRRKFGQNENLLICDFLCHGVPSAKVFKEALEEIETKQKKKILDYQFRTKDFGWTSYGVNIAYDNKRVQKTVGRCDWFFTATMLDNLFLRDSCYTCDRAAYHEADITLGDFWGIAKYKPEINDQKGISVLLVNTKKGSEALREVSQKCELYPLEKKYIDYGLAVKTNDKKKVQKDKHFQEYMQLGTIGYVKKYYKKRLFLAKLAFALKKRKLQKVGKR